MIEQTLSPEQRDIVNQWLAKEEPILVEASAGSGKTRVLTESVRTIIKNSPQGRSKILCLTFTNKAAEEMQERLKDVRKIKERTFIGTTHAFALDIIKSRRHEIGIDNMPTIIDKESDRIELITEVFLSNSNLAPHFLNPNTEQLEKFKNLQSYQADLLNKCSQFIRRKKQNLIWLNDQSDNPPDSDWSPSRISLYKDYNDLLRNQNLIDYDDIILLAWKILSERKAVANLYRRIFEYVMVDEAQDLSFAQYELIKALCGKKLKRIMMVGDTNQAIHGYAGASSRFMKEEFTKDFALLDHQKKKIEFNYRSSKSVINLANELAGIQQANGDSYYQGAIEYHSFKNEENEADWVINKIRGLVGIENEGYDGKLTLNKIAILGRNKFVFSTIIEKLKQDSNLSKNYILKKGSEILDPQSTTIKIFDLGIRILSNQSAYLYYNQLIDVLDINNGYDLVNEVGLDILENTVSNSNLDYIPKNVFKAIINGWEKIEKDINGFPDILDEILEISSEIQEENERDLIHHDIIEWKGAWHKYIRSVKANSKSVSDFRRFLSMGITKTQNQNGLTLATIHTVKGLEFYVVFLIGMGQGTFPDYRAIRKNNLREEKNNAYVAVSRAKRDLYITFPLSKYVPWGEQNQEKSEFFSNKEFKNVM